jgi:hypothetical protein
MQDPNDKKNYIWKGKSYKNTNDPNHPDYPTIEHIGDGVIGHWNDKGRKTNQTERKDFFNEIGDLEIMPKFENESKGGSQSGSANHRVTMKFRGPGVD